MQYLCSQCRRPLETGMTMCRCGQLFSAVPTYDPNSLSNYWPPAADTRHAALQWLDGLSPAIKASVAGGVALILALIVVISGVSNYQRMHARYAPGAPVMTAGMPVPVQAPAAAPTSLSTPAPVVMRAAPKYVPPQGKSLYVPPVDGSDGNRTNSVPSEQAAPLGTNQSGISPAAYADAKADAKQAVYDARNYVNSLTPADYQRSPISLQNFVSRVKQDRGTMLGSSAVNPQDLAEVDADQRSIQGTEDICNRNRGSASIDMG